MKSFLNDKILRTIPVIFFIVIALKITYTYFETKQRAYEFAQKEAEVLNSYLMENRIYYQNLFIDGTLTLSEKTIPALPAFSSHIISEQFSNNNPLGITIKTVSDRARNERNAADEDELKAIEFFRNNLDKKVYFNSQNKDFYQYATALKVEPVCLKCHGKKEDAPDYIRRKYANAYNYKLGDIRGIVSIQIPTKKIHDYFFKNFFKTSAYDLMLLLLLYFGVLYLMKQSKKINKALEEKIAAKTKELKESLLRERLTKLPNRLKLIEDIQENQNVKASHLALINIDSFKDINDLYGYGVGDALLLQVAQEIKRLCKDASSVYKLPNDEFAVFTIADIGEDTFLAHIKTLIDALNEIKFDVAGESIVVSFSCAVASNKSSLLIKASSALQIAKKHARNIVVYKDSLDSKKEIMRNIDALLLLKNAIKNDRITPYYQPIYNVKTEAIEKYESLARIITDEGKVIAPFVFLDVAVKSKLYPEITKAMIRKTFSFFENKSFSFSINLSIMDIQNKEIARFIQKSLQDFSEPERIIFEILESDKIDNYEEIKEFIKELKSYGCQVAIDDFGSGYSNFSHVLGLNVDFLKIDASLIKHISSEENSKAIVKTIISFAANLKLQTIAEYVEDKDSFDLLKKMGVDFIQGYYIGKPKKDLLT